MTKPRLQFENAVCTQVDETITVTAIDLTNVVWKSDKKVVTGLSYDSATDELTVVKDFLIIQSVSANS